MNLFSVNIHIQSMEFRFFSFLLGINIEIPRIFVVFTAYEEALFRRDFWEWERSFEWDFWLFSRDDFLLHTIVWHGVIKTIPWYIAWEMSKRLYVKWMFTQCIPLRVTHCHQRNSQVRVCLELSFKKAEKCRVDDESAEDDEEIFLTFINHLEASLSHRSYFILVYRQMLLVVRILMLHVSLLAWYKRWTFKSYVYLPFVNSCYPFHIRISSGIQSIFEFGSLDLTRTQCTTEWWFHSATIFTLLDVFSFFGVSNIFLSIFFHFHTIDYRRRRVFQLVLYVNIKFM